MTTPTNDDRLRAIDVFDDLGIAATETERARAIFRIRDALMEARLAERTRCAGKVCAYCDMGWELSGEVHERPKGAKGFPQFARCKAAAIMEE